MTSQEIIDSLKKLQYQVSILGHAIDHSNYPVESLIMEFNWAQEDMDEVHSIFGRWDSRLSGGGQMDSGEFEADFKSGLGISYQGLKSVILAFHKNGQWKNVCVSYAKSLGNAPPVEFRSIT